MRLQFCLNLCRRIILIYLAIIRLNIFILQKQLNALLKCV